MLHMYIFVYINAHIQTLEIRQNYEYTYENLLQPIFFSFQAAQLRSFSKWIECYSYSFISKWKVHFIVVLVTQNDEQKNMSLTKEEERKKN